ncbi:MAG TPA: DUF998 domain-containing protein [Streptosporangiaceae bacterium]|nr:DUF998 domain-containing protein [Streptosporangiaceae bacterium]
MTVPSAAGSSVAALSATAPAGRSSTARRVLAWVSGIAGLIAYNWWVLVPLKPGLMASPDEFFSNLEVNGQPYATVMQHCDVASGVLVLLAFLLAGYGSLGRARREWLCMVVFALAGLMGGLFSQVCADGVSKACFSAEWHFRLPASQYVHDSAGIVEFAAITLALLFAVLRTWGERTRPGRIYRSLAIGAAIAYPLLAVAYFGNRLGAVVEGIFFVGFTIMVVTQLVERVGRRQRRELSPDHNLGTISETSTVG